MCRSLSTLLSGVFVVFAFALFAKAALPPCDATIAVDQGTHCAETLFREPCEVLDLEAEPSCSSSGGEAFFSSANSRWLNCETDPTQQGNISTTKCESMTLYCGSKCICGPTISVEPCVNNPEEYCYYCMTTPV